MPRLDKPEGELITVSITERQAAQVSLALAYAAAAGEVPAKDALALADILIAAMAEREEKPR